MAFLLSTAITVSKTRNQATVRAQLSHEAGPLDKRRRTSQAV